LAQNPPIQTTGGISFGLLCVIGMISVATRPKVAQHFESHFATRRELKAYLVSKADSQLSRAIIIGRSNGWFNRKVIAVFANQASRADLPNTAVIGSPGNGKTQAITATMLKFGLGKHAGNLIAIDPKGDLYSTTAVARERAGQRAEGCISVAWDEVP
jgi:type VI protein secretion system component VasK